MPVFINKESKFEIKVFYTDIGNKVVIHNEELPNCKVQKFWFRNANWEDACDIMSSSFVPYEGVLILNPYVFMDVKLRRLMAGWDIKDEQGNDVPFHIDSISSINPAVAEYLSKKIDEVIFPNKEALESAPAAPAETKTEQPKPEEPKPVVKTGDLAPLPEGAKPFCEAKSENAEELKLEAPKEPIQPVSETPRKRGRKQRKKAEDSGIKNQEVLS